MRHERIDPQAYTLLGLIAHAAGQMTEAEGHFNWAVYLDPEQQEALIHLALLAESRGDQNKAAVLKKRVARLETKTD